LDETVFIPDVNDPNLPAYTEWGYNSFGAKYEQAYFVMHVDKYDKYGYKTDTPCKITYQQGILHFSFIGRITHREKMNDTDKKVTLTISFPVSPMGSFKDLQSLHNTTIDLTGTDCTLENGGDTTSIAPLSGHLTIKRAQLLYVDDQLNRAILSGVFDLNGKAEKFTDGRFDFGINASNFSIEALPL
jgi:hypothetical protein